MGRSLGSRIALVVARVAHLVLFACVCAPTVHTCLLSQECTDRHHRSNHTNHIKTQLHRLRAPAPTILLRSCNQGQGRTHQQQGWRRRRRLASLSEAHLPRCAHPHARAALPRPPRKTPVPAPRREAYGGRGAGPPVPDTASRGGAAATATARRPAQRDGAAGRVKGGEYGEGCGCMYNVCIGVSGLIVVIERSAITWIEHAMSRER